MIEFLTANWFYVFGALVAAFVAFQERQHIPGIAKLVMPKSTQLEKRQEITESLIAIAERIRQLPDKPRGDQVHDIGVDLLKSENCKHKAQPIE